MGELAGKRITIIGGSAGVGREIAFEAVAQGLEVEVVARGEDMLGQLRAVQPSIRTITGDATELDTAERVMATGPDFVVLAAGAIPPTQPLSELSWTDFSKNWEVDVKASFYLCKCALKGSLPAGGRVLLLSSGAALGGSPISGGYAGAKRMQMFMADYAQRQSDAVGLGARFTALAPGRIMPETRLGKAAAEGYARFLGTSAEEFVNGMPDRQSARETALAALAVLAGDHDDKGSMLVVTGRGVAAA